MNEPEPQPRHDRWADRVGLDFLWGGLPFRIRRGNRAPEDQRLDWKTPSGWRGAPMKAHFFMTDFFCSNEDYLKEHKPNWNFGGAEYFMRGVNDARKYGFERPVAGLLDDLAGLQGVALRIWHQTGLTAATGHWDHCQECYITCGTAAEGMAHK